MTVRFTDRRLNATIRDERQDDDTAPAFQRWLAATNAGVPLDQKIHPVNPRYGSGDLIRCHDNATVDLDTVPGYVREHLAFRAVNDE